MVVSDIQYKVRTDFGALAKQTFISNERTNGANETFAIYCESRNIVFFLSVSYRKCSLNCKSSITCDNAGVKAFVSERSH